jgi:hypothetical protein
MAATESLESLLIGLPLDMSEDDFRGISGDNKKALHDATAKANQFALKMTVGGILMTEGIHQLANLIHHLLADVR